jgi:hypothetical protein
MTSVGQFKRELEYKARRLARKRNRHVALPVPPSANQAAVLDYRERSEAALSCRDLPEVPAHDPETSAGTRPRPPPAS